MIRSRSLVLLVVCAPGSRPGSGNPAPRVYQLGGFLIHTPVMVDATSSSHAAMDVPSPTLPLDPHSQLHDLQKWNAIPQAACVPSPPQEARLTLKTSCPLRLRHLDATHS